MMKVTVFFNSRLYFYSCTTTTTTDANKSNKAIYLPTHFYQFLLRNNHFGATGIEYFCGLRQAVEFSAKRIPIHSSVCSGYLFKQFLIMQETHSSTKKTAQVSE